MLVITQNRRGIGTTDPKGIFHMMSNDLNTLVVTQNRVGIHTIDPKGELHIRSWDNGNGAFSAMKMALSNSKLNPEDLQYINAHGTSTPLGDMIELRTVIKLLGNHVDKIAMSSTKSSIGHLRFHLMRD